MYQVLTTALLLSLGGLCLASNEKPPEERRREFVVVGYVPDYQIEALDPEVGACVTDVVFFSIEPTPAGELKTGRLTAQGLRKLGILRDRYKNRVLISIGGWGRSQAFGAMATDPQSRGRFVQNLVRFCAENHFDGADFDWEHAKGAAEMAAYGDLLAETKAAFRPRHLLVTVAAADWQDLGAKAYQAVDRIHVMAYDHEGERHSTFEQAKADVRAFFNRGAPGGKLCLGLPFYGRSMTNHKQSMAYAMIINKFSPPSGADEAGGMYFNGIDTIRRKTRYARGNGLAGVMIWELGQDAKGKASLLGAIRDASN